LAARCGAK
jgi:type I protein arginine methyltransferase